MDTRHCIDKEKCNVCTLIGGIQPLQLGADLGKKKKKKILFHFIFTEFESKLNIVVNDWSLAVLCPPSTNASTVTAWSGHTRAAGSSLPAPAIPAPATAESAAEGE